MSHRHPDAVGVEQGGGARFPLMVMGIEGHHGENLAGAQANAEIDHPDEATGKGGRIERQAPPGTGRVEAHEGESDHPMDDGLRTRCLPNAQGAG